MPLYTYENGHSPEHWETNAGEKVEQQEQSRTAGTAPLEDWSVVSYKTKPTLTM